MARETRRLTRRGFLLGAGRLAVGCALGAFWKALPVTAAEQEVPRWSIVRIPRVPADISLVLDATCNRVIAGRRTNRRLLQALIEFGLRTWTRRDDPAVAWRRFVNDRDVIAVVFCKVGAEGIGTHADMSVAILRSLLDAGFNPRNIMLINADKAVRDVARTRAVPFGWQRKQVDFGSGKDYLPNWLGEATAIVNVPFLKDHNISGISGALRNISLPLLKHPAKYYRNGCDPYIADVVNLPEIRGKLRINIVNALRGVFDGGPDAQEERFIWQHQGLLFATDPVATDYVVWRMIERKRAEAKLPTLSQQGRKPRHIITAAALGLGNADPDFIRYFHTAV